MENNSLNPGNHIRVNEHFPKRITMSKRITTILVSIIAVIFLGYYFFNFYQLFSKSYYVEEDHLHRVGTFQLLNRAHEQLEFYGRSNSYRHKKLVFQSKDYYSFAIDRHIFQAIIDEKELKDTLMYAGLPFTVYTDKESFDQYKKAMEPIYVRVFQIEIGGKKYIDISKMNDLSGRSILSGVIFWPAVIFSFWFALSNKISYPVKRRVIILFIFWLAMMTVLIIWA